MLGRRRRRQANMKSALVYRVMFDWYTAVRSQKGVSAYLEELPVGFVEQYIGLMKNVSPFPFISGPLLPMNHKLPLTHPVIDGPTKCHHCGLIMIVYSIFWLE